MVPESIIWALEFSAPSFVEFSCKKGEEEKILSDFDEIFKEKWHITYENLKEELGEDEEDYYPYSEEESYPACTAICDGRAFAFFEPLLISYCYGEFCEVESPCEALEDALKELKEKYPDIEYDGLILFPWSDRRCGDTEQFVVTSGENKDVNRVFPVFGEIIDAAVGGNMHGLQKRVRENDEDDDLEYSFLFNLKEELDGADIDEYKNVLKFLDEYSGCISDDTREKIVKTLHAAAMDSDDDDALKLVIKWKPKISTSLETDF